ncbi:MAG: asparagine synthase-related protein, partial [Actinomycetota bacterium]
LRGVTALLGSGDSEGEFARLVAERLQIQVDVIVGNAMPVLSPEEPPSLVTPEPTPYRPTPFQYELARASAGHSPTTLCGVAGDALLLSGPWYWAEWLREGQVVRLAKAWRAQCELGGRPHPHLHAGVHHLRRRAPHPLPGWLAPELPTTARSIPDFPGGRDARTIAGDLRWSVLFLWGDPTFTGLPVHFRYPLVDLRLIRFVLAIPPEPWLVNKRILREATATRLPAAVRARPKTPLGRGQPGWEDVGQVADFVRTVPGFDRFVRPDDLAQALRTRRGPDDYREEGRLERAVGLAHWMSHWRSPRRQDSAVLRW